MQPKMYNPDVTYRLQFHKGFNFDAFEAVIPYLIKLGIKTIYASPIFKAVPDSVHGYDVVDPHMINPEIGTLEQLYKISGLLKAAGIGWMQDIVPNHMAFHMDNAWLMDVFEKGQASAYATYFDINWEHPLLEGKVMLPILGKSLAEAIKDKELLIVYNEEKLGLKYFDTIVPLQQASYAVILNGKKDNIDTRLAAINNDATALQQIIDQQYYLPCLWQITDTQINYRRFFTINGLISLNIQEESVFNHYHSFIKKLCDDGIFQGLRVDHVDGLADPTQYLHRLRKLSGEQMYITVEKILEYKEELPAYWPIAGTTGYDFLAIASNLFTNSRGEYKLKQYYDKEIANGIDYTAMLHQKKKLILDRYMRGDLDNLYQLFLSLQLTDKEKQADAAQLKKAIGEILIACPVYRYYGNQLPLGDEEGRAIKNLLNKVKAHDNDLIAAIEVIEDAILVKPLAHDEAYNNRAIQFYQRCMQFAGPLMAKGGEDTAMYLYNSFIAHNDVGDTPEATDSSINAYHQQIMERQKWPYTMNTTATHDTKRGEDARARLNVLTDIANEWIETVQEWQEINMPFKQGKVPDKNDEYFIYQSLAGFYPMPGEHAGDFNERFSAYIEKALREAKRHTDWAEPDEAYEGSVKEFIDAILNTGSPFWKSFMKFQNRIVDAGIINSLVQLILKFTSPGVADVYQGGELWDLSMVDPDNRRPIDYTHRALWLGELQNEKANLSALWTDRYNGKIKLWLTSILIKARKQAPDLFTDGAYVALKTRGKYKNNILSFARVYNHTAYIVAVPVNILTVAAEQECNVMDIDWADTLIHIPDDLQKQWISLPNGTTLEKLQVPVNELFKEIPFAIYESREPKQ